MYKTPFQKALQDEITRLNTLHSHIFPSASGFFTQSRSKRYTVKSQYTKRRGNFFTLSLRFLSLFF